MAFGTRQQAEDLYGEIKTVLATVGLRLAPEKTQVVGSTGASIFSASASSGTDRKEATGN
ncbi:hypothetical protein G8767_27075 [Rhodococcus sp. IC4_135]|uniref:hypothetical protein n=1 Tax=Rhodococcus sp. IC4_135 TaxID=2715537 RepID=UPI0014230F67|nr:hypothetical protein [Rhodococcus sp. IC4_135]